MLIAISGVAQEEFTLVNQHNGNYDFTMIGATMNSQPNVGGSSCNDYNLPPGETASADLNLDADQTIIAAYLYWSSYTQSNPDQFISLNGNLIIAESIYTDSFNIYDFYACTADVTDYVQSQGNTTYTVADLDINRNVNCTVSYGGWGMIVVYEDADLTKNSVNIYEGFRGITTNSGRPPVTIPITELLVANDSGSSLGLLAWEGDRSIGPPNWDEQVRFNGNVLSTPMNPGDNLFNGTNSFTGDEELYNMDLDGFAIDEYVEVGDNSAEIYVESEQDLVLLNVIAFTLNNELPDPTLQIDNLAAPNCDDEEVQVSFTVNNVNANDVLPVGTSVKFYIEDTDSAPVAEEFTTVELPIDGSESLTTTFNIPPGTPDEFTLIGTVNLDEDGEIIFLELNSTNNTTEIDFFAPQSYNVEDDATICDNESYELVDGTVVEDPGTYTATVPAMNGCDSTVVLTLSVNPIPETEPAELVECTDNNQATFNLSEVVDQFPNGTDYTYEFYDSEEDATNQSDPLPTEYTATGPSETVFVRAENTVDCANITPLELIVSPDPTIGNITNEDLCDNDGDGEVSFDLTSKNDEVLNGEDPSNHTIWYFENETDAENGNSGNAIADPGNYSVTSSPLTIFVRLESALTGNCFSTDSFQFTLLEGPMAADVPVSVPNCSLGTTGFFDLTAIALDVANGDSSMDVTFYPTVADAETGTDEIMNPDNYESPTTTIAGLVTHPDTGCTSIGLIDLTVIEQPLVNPQQIETCATNSENSEAIINLSQFTEDIIGGISNVSVTYHEELMDAENGSQPISNPENFSSGSQIVYARSETNSNGTVCYSLSEIDITINNRPNANNISYPLCSATDEQSFDLMSRNEEIISNSENYSITYYDTASNAENGTTAGQLNSPLTSGSTTVFARIVNNETSCSSVSEIELIVESTPVVDAGDLQFSECRKNSQAQFNLDLYKQNLQNSYPDYSFEFYSDAQSAEEQSGSAILSQVVTGTDQSVFLRTNDNATVCYTVEEIVLNVEPVPLLDEGDVIICLNNGYTLPNGEQVFEPGLYERDITNPETGCDMRTRTNLILGSVMFPNAFGPNTNGYNDTFRPVPGEECVGEVTDFELKIFNRWGELVFETSNFAEGWNGIYEGRPAQKGIYIYHSTFTFLGEEQEHKGTVKLIR